MITEYDVEAAIRRYAHTVENWNPSSVDVDLDRGEARAHNVRGTCVYTFKLDRGRVRVTPVEV